MSVNRMFTLPSVYDDVLTALSKRQAVLANNLANVNTPGFKRSDVDFASVFDQALRRINDGKEDRLVTREKSQLRVIHDRSTSMRNDGNNVDVEREMALMAETSIRYNTLAEYLSRRMGILQTAVTDGRR